MQIEKNNYPELIENKFEFKITKGQKPIRLDTFLTNSIHNASRNKVQLSIDAGNVLVNGQMKKASYKISPADEITCIVMQMPPIELIPEDIPIDIVYEDEHLLVLNKNAGMCVHPGVGNRYGTLINALLFYFGHRENITFNVEDLDDSEINFSNHFQNTETLNNNIRPGLVHRIDKNTSGLLVIAKRQDVHNNLSNQFANKTTEREYYAIVWGKPKFEYTKIEANIGRSSKDRTSFAVLYKEGKPAITECWVSERFLYTSLLKFKLLTGRTHQIRVHSGSIGHKLFGDERYGGNNIINGKENPQWRSIAAKLLSTYPRQMLHAKTLGFMHPITQKRMLFTSDLPADMLSVIDAMRHFSL
ncbi:MAG: RluA family pseudouridine synthase [Bacteroidetes bacterium]|nr:RluA family pseudouridine synthase [Bacteroidota bacterium]